MVAGNPSSGSPRIVTETGSCDYRSRLRSLRETRGTSLAEVTQRLDAGLWIPAAASIIANLDPAPKDARPVAIAGNEPWLRLAIWHEPGNCTIYLEDETAELLHGIVD